jgi:hypothetical protein
METNNNNLKDKHLVFSNKIQQNNYQIFNYTVNNGNGYVENSKNANQQTQGQNHNDFDVFNKDKKFILESVFQDTNDEYNQMEVDEIIDEMDTVFGTGNTSNCDSKSSKKLNLDHITEDIEYDSNDRFENINSFSSSNNNSVNNNRDLDTLDNIELNGFNIDENLNSLDSFRQYALNIFKTALTSKLTLEYSLENDVPSSSIDYNFSSIFNQNGCDSSQKNLRKKIKLSSSPVSSTIVSGCSSRSASYDCLSNMNYQNNQRESTPTTQDQMSKPVSNFSNSYSNSNYLELKPLNHLHNYNLNQLNVTRKDTLLYLIERNKIHKIYSPFDSYIFTKLRPNHKYIVSFNNDNISFLNTKQEEKIDTTHIYNYLNIKKLSKVNAANNNINQMENSYLKHNSLMPNCMSTLMMPFFFDIFSMTDLNKLDRETLGMINLLKKSYITRANLDFQLMTSYITENLVWNCIILYKLRFNDNFDNRMGYFNFYLTYLYMSIYLKNCIQFINNELNPVSKSCMYKLDELKSTLPYLLEAFILNGLIKQSDYVKIKKFLNKKLFLSTNNDEYTNSHELKNDYLNTISIHLQNRLEVDDQRCNTNKINNDAFPLKLKDLCRLRVKSCMNTYDLSQIEKLNVPLSVKEYLNFDDELKKIYSVARNFLNKNV